MSLMPIRPPGLSTRAISVSTAGLSTERLMTQLEMTTSTESAGSGISSMTPLRKIAFRMPASGRSVREGEHLVGHVEPVGDPGLADPLGGEESMPPPEPRSSTVSPRGARRRRPGCRSLVIEHGRSAARPAPRPRRTLQRWSWRSAGRRHSSPAAATVLGSLRSPRADSA